MLDRPICAHSEVFYPNDLDDLKAVFDALCLEFHVLPDTSEAQAIAGELIRLFQSGMTNQGMLLVAMRHRLQDSWKFAG